MIDIGLNIQHQQKIVQLLEDFPDVEQGIIFGSRAKGNYKKGSDIDLALKGKSLHSDTVQKVHYMLEEETLLPYFFDVLNYHEISSKDLIEHIDRVGVLIYKKK